MKFSFHQPNAAASRALRAAASKNTEYFPCYMSERFNMEETPFPFVTKGKWVRRGFYVALSDVRWATRTKTVFQGPSLWFGWDSYEKESGGELVPPGTICWRKEDISQASWPNLKKYDFEYEEFEIEGEVFALVKGVKEA